MSLSKVEVELPAVGYKKGEKVNGEVIFMAFAFSVNMVLSDNLLGSGTIELDRSQLAATLRVLEEAQRG